MIETDPRFMIFYVPPFLTFGGIKINLVDYDSSKFNEEVSDTIVSIGKSLENAYEVKTKVESIDRYSMITNVRPLTSELDRKSIEVNIKDVDIGATRYIKNVSRKMVETHKNSAIITREDGFDVFHILEKNFNPQNTEYLLKTIESLLFTVGGRSYNIRSSIENDSLNIKLKLNKPPSFYV